MRAILIIGLASLLPSCSSTTCGTGTIERGGNCVPADETTGSAACGPDTMLVGNQCVSTVVCDPDTTTPTVDPTTGMTVCKGNGAGGGCSACPTPTSPSTQQTICGQIYDFENNQAFAASGATGMKCPATPTASGPCALKMQAYDAVAFATNPQTAQPLTVGETCIDDMGRYYLKDITVPTNPFIGVGLDDANAANMGPGGVTNAVGTVSPVAPGAALAGVEQWIVTAATTTSWQSSGGPSISTGYFVPVYRAHCANTTGNDPQCTGDPLANQSGVQFTKSGATEPSNTFYFTAAQTTRDTVDTAATATGANGTALVDNASVNDNVAYSGTGGLTDTTNCKWESHAGATLPGIVTIQIFRPVDTFQHKCAE